MSDHAHQTDSVSYSHRYNLLIWMLFCVIAGGIFIAYSIASLAGGHGNILMPLDDVYIHFQYAKQIATGQPYVYNPGLEPTSGATSFLYPYVLAVGYLLGFQGLNLGLWAMGIGALALVGSMWVIYRLCRLWAVPEWLCAFTAITFALTGSVSWHFMSGMETGLVIFFTLLTLYSAVDRKLDGFVIAVTLLALIRPEAGMMALAAAGVYALAGYKTEMLQLVRLKRPPDTRFFWLILPILAFGVQPVVNWLFTGSATASGASAKSLLSMVPHDWNLILSRILENYGRMWSEFFAGYSPERDLWYLVFLTVPVGLLGLLRLLRNRENRWAGVMLVSWLLILPAAIATLDTAFWHFKRYQMPVMVLFYPLSAYAVAWFLQRLQTAASPNIRHLRYGVYAFDLVVVPAFVVLMAVTFWQFHVVNVRYVYDQPYQMARWLAENTPEDAVVAVHDVGMMRYMGGRTTLDMVGLTTPGAAQYWRNGPGSVAEFLLRNRPDYIASYGRGHGFGLGMVADTRLYGEPLAAFPVELNSRVNVALAADFQGIYQPDWSAINGLSLLPFEDAQLLDRVNVADIEHEQAADYAFTNTTQPEGYPTEVFEWDVPGCEENICRLIDGGRRINGEERFILHIPDEGLDTDSGALLVSVVHPIQAGTLDIYVNGTPIDTQWIPQNPGHWLMLQTYIPPEHLSDLLYVRIVPHFTQGAYNPFRHTLYTGYRPVIAPDTIIASYQEGAFVLSEAALVQSTEQLTVNLRWFTQGDAAGDYRFFVHLYSDINVPPIAQSDGYSGNGTLLPGNWLPGALDDTIKMDIREVPPGVYQLAIGFYDPQSGERLVPVSDSLEVTSDGRLFLDEVEIPENGG